MLQQLKVPLQKCGWRQEVIAHSFKNKFFHSLGYSFAFFPGAFFNRSSCHPKGK